MRTDILYLNISILIVVTVLDRKVGRAANRIRNCFVHGRMLSTLGKPVTQMGRDGLAVSLLYAYPKGRTGKQSK